MHTLTILLVHGKMAYYPGEGVFPFKEDGGALRRF